MAITVHREGNPRQETLAQTKTYTEVTTSPDGFSKSAQVFTQNGTPLTSIIVSNSDFALEMEFLEAEFNAIERFLQKQFAEASAQKEELRELGEGNR